MGDQARGQGVALNWHVSLYRQHLRVSLSLLLLLLRPVGVVRGGPCRRRPRLSSPSRSRARQTPCSAPARSRVQHAGVLSNARAHC